MPESEINLRQRREEKGITLEEIHAVSKIPIRILKAIEELKFDQLPEPSFARNLITSYGKYTGIDPTPILKLYEEYVSHGQRPARKPPEQSEWEMGARKTFPLWGIGTAAFLALFAVVLFYILTERPHPIPPPTPPEQKASPPAAAEPVSEKETEMKITIAARELAWIRITADDEPPTEVLLRPGEKIERTALNSISLDIGNAGGVDVNFRGKSLGKLGQSGEVVHLKLP